MANRWDIIDRIAAELGAKANARRMWKARGRVPFRWQLDILDAAKGRRDIKPPLSRADFAKFPEDVAA